MHSTLGRRSAAVPCPGDVRQSLPCFLQCVSGPKRRHGGRRSDLFEQFLYAIHGASGIRGNVAQWARHPRSYAHSFNDDGTGCGRRKANSAQFPGSLLAETQPPCMRTTRQTL